MTSAPCIIVDVVDLNPGLGDDFALTVRWEDGSETVELVSARGARVFGYDPGKAAVEGASPSPAGATAPASSIQ